MNPNNEEVIQQHLDTFEKESAPGEGHVESAEGIGGEESSRKEDLATEKQLRFLEKLGVEVTPNLTKKEASLLIDNALLRKVT